MFLRSNLIILVALFTGILQVNAQSLSDYKGLESIGHIPKDFTSLFTETYEEGVDNLDPDQKKKVKKAKKEYLMQTSFSMNRMLGSGKVLYNDPVSKYVRQVFEEVKSKSGESVKDVRIYLLNSSAVNAFASDQGIILITTGLVAKLQNEAQLAFILSHELTHYKKKHGFKRHQIRQDLTGGNKILRKLSLTSKLLFHNSYSRENEKEADLEGFKTFSATNYDASEIEGVFDILKYSYLPPDYGEIDFSLFEASVSRFPEYYKLAAVNKPGDYEKKFDIEDDDRFSTHPAVDKRKKAIDEKIKGLEETKRGKSKFVLEEDFFNTVNALAKFELCQLYYANENYEAAIYNCLGLLKSYPENKYLQKVIGRSLVRMTQFSNEQDKYTFHYPYYEVEGEFQRLVRLFDDMSGKEINVLAMDYVWNMHTLHPDDKDYQAMVEDLSYSLAYHHYDSDKKSYLEQDELVLEGSRLQQMIIEKRKSLGIASVDNGYYNVTLRKLLENKKLEQKLDSVQEFANEETREKELEDELGTAATGSDLAKEKRKGFNLGIEKMVVIDPFFSRLNSNGRKAKMDNVKSEQLEVFHIERLESTAKIAGLHLTVLDYKTLGKSDDASFNDMTLLKSWIEERLRLEHRGIPYSNIDRELTDKLIERYGTKYFCWTWGEFNSYPKPNKAQTIVGSLFLGPFIPFAIWTAFRKNHYTHFYTYIYNIETGERHLESIRTLRTRPGKDMHKMFLYDLLVQIKGRK